MKGGSLFFLGETSHRNKGTTTIPNKGGITPKMYLLNSSLSANNCLRKEKKMNI